MTRAGRSTSCALGALLSLATAEASDGPRRPPAFGASIDVVGLSVSVTDDRNRFVGDLRESDFAVFEDGTPQRLLPFEREEVPISLVLMIDASASMADNLEAARSAATRLLRTLGPRDRAQVVQFAERTELLQDFTSDQPALEEAIRTIQAAGQTALCNALYDVLKRIARLRQGGERRRWAVILLSDGADTLSLVTEIDVLDQARKADVTVHTVGLRPRRVPREERLTLGRAWHFLASLARETGGEAYLPRSITELDGLYERIAQALRTQYLLGYVSTNSRRDGGWRRIQVRIPGRADLAARHRPGYYAPSR